ncbi:MAG: class I SAM-dependent methyltransferase [Deltaproteobacteria bacterium]|nr:class I SAM-dependent methyltransferase [Deltaproteobacteria bacterium]
MGLIFDENTLSFYDSWRRSSQNRAIERSLEHMLKSMLAPRSGERVLDIGCGTGNHLLILNKMGLDISGTDASPFMVQKARERLGHRCTVKLGTTDDLPFDDNEFDYATLINTLEFLDNPLLALREAGRVTNKKVFIGVWNSLSWNGLLKKIHGFFGDPLFSQARLYNLWQVKSLLRLAYGPAPISWQCVQIRPSFSEETPPPENGMMNRNHSPLGFFLGLSATLVYRVKTDNLPLKVRLKTAGRSPVVLRPLRRTRQAQRTYQR